MAKRQSAKAPWRSVQVPPELQGMPGYPVIQWLNDLSDLRCDCDKSRGGAFLPARYGEYPLSGGVPASYNDDDGLYFPEMRVAVLATRWRWVRPREGDIPELPVKVYQADQNYRKRVQALVVFPDTPTIFVFTSIGSANKSFTRAVKTLQTIAQSAGAHPWMFWVKVRAGARQKLGKQQGKTSPIEVELPDAQALADAYIGDRMVEFVTSRAAEIARWRDEWAEWMRLGDGESEDDDSGGASMPPTPEQGDVRLRTKKYGSVSLRELFERDPTYALEVCRAIVNAPDQYHLATVAAAQAYVLHTAASQPQPAMEEEIPF